MSPAPVLRRSLALLLAAASVASASPYPRSDILARGLGSIMARDCNPCGAESQLCCGSDERCMTLEGDIATCAGAGGGSHPYQTVTWTETRTFTSTLMTWWEPAPEPTAGVDCVPKNDQQEACGAICCAGWQTCADFEAGQCSAKPGYDEPSTIIITTDGTVTTQYSAPYRVTGTTTVVTTDTVTEGGATSTSTEEDPSATSDPIGAGGGGGGGLSGGAIAGIVIGSIAGAMLLLLLAFCCIARGLWKACFGGKKKERTEVIEERYSRHGSRPPSAYSRRPKHKGWFGFGGGGGGGSAAGSEKKSSGKRWLGLAGLAATLLALLNMKKEKKPARKGGGRSRYSDSYYSYSDYTSPSSSSSGRRTHRTASRGPPTSHYTKTSRRS